MSLFHAWLFLLLFFGVTEFPTLFSQSMGTSVFQHLAQWANPRNHSFGYNARRSAWVVLLVYLVWQGVRGLF